MDELTNKLVELRKYYGYSQSHVASKLGIETLDYMGYENGRSVPSFEVLKKLAKLYHVEVEDLFINSHQIKLEAQHKNDIDAKNYEYLTKQAKKNALKAKIKNHKKEIIIAIVIFIILIVLLFGLNMGNASSEINREYKGSDLLSASDTTVVYIDSTGVAFGNGDNSNGQLELSNDKLIKVVEGATFTVGLKDDHTLISSGLLTKYADEIASLNNIVDVEVGNGHIVTLNNNGKVNCTGSNASGQCDLAKDENIADIFASKNATFLLDNEGNVYASGEFNGKSKIKGIKNIIDIDTSDNITAYVNEIGDVIYYANHGNYSLVPTWHNIIDIAVGNEFIAALDANGKVYIDIENYRISDEVLSWSNIIAIDAGKDYLVAYDGQKIYGVGNNAYGQFELSESQKIALPSITNIRISQDEHNLIIDFDEVLNASEYRLSMDVGAGIAVISHTNQFVIELEKLEDGKNYTIELIAVGNDRYEDSQEVVTNYKHIKKEISEPQETEDVNEVEIPFTLDMLDGKTKASFESYFKGFGVSEDKLFAHETEIPCSGNEAIILGVSGVSNYQSLTKSELLEKEIHYYYCKVGD